MLVLTRKSGEGICIGDDIKIVVTQNRGKIRVGIAAPPEIRIRRCELTNRREVSVARQTCKSV